MNRLTGKRWSLPLLLIGLLLVVGVGIAAQEADSPKRAPTVGEKPDAPKADPAKGAARTKPSGGDADEGKMTPVKIDTSGPKPKAVVKADPAPGIAHMRLSGAVLDAPPEFSLFGNTGAYMTLREWLRRLAKARNDGQVKAVALEIDSPKVSWAQAQELADALRRLNKVKPVHTHLSSGSPMAYLIASAGREVSIEPGGTLWITGLGAEMMFFRGTLDWLGIQPQFVQIGKFKGAAEPMSRTQPSKELAGEVNKLLDDLYDQLCGQIARQRGVTVPHVKHVIDQGPLSAREARKFRLVDRLIPRADWREYVAGKYPAEKDDPGARWVKNYAPAARKSVDPSNPWQLLSVMFGDSKGKTVRDPTIAIVHAEGMIVPGESGEGLLGQRFVGSRTMVRTFERIAEDDRIKAVIFRINSPGGSALASEQIFQAARKCGKTKPVIASISSVGASGGYYIALGARTIIADAAGVVGSIGVVSGKLAITGLIDKIGVSTYEVTRGKNAGLWMSRAWTAEEQAVIRRHARQTYVLFTRRVGESRAGKVKDVAQVAQGRVFTARQATRNGLVDSVGGLREAILAAQKAAGVDKVHFITLPEPKTLSDVLFGPSGAASPIPRFPSAESELLGRLSKRSGGLVYLVNLAARLDREAVLTAMPYWLAVRH